jgi:uncharacterized iron-regulated membrane protein
MTFRSFLFWLHLVAGLIAGLAIGIMCLTGVALAYEKELVAWAERDARRVTAPPPGTPRLTLEQLQEKLRAAQPEVRPSGIAVQADPLAAVAFTAGRNETYYIDPYTGEVRQPASRALADFMHVMTDWHRYLALTGDHRGTGKLINGVCNLAFLVLAVTGLYLWLPRSWSWRALRPVIWFRQNASAKARDFNWHNAIGFWTAPVLIVLTLTAVPISFRWGGTVISALTGTPESAGGGPGPGGRGPGGPGGGPAVLVTPPAPGTPALPLDALLATAQREAPTWTTISLRLGGAPEGRGGPGGPRGGGGRGGESVGGAGGPRGVRTASSPATAARPRPDTAPRAREAGSESSTPATTFLIRTADSWPRTASTTIALNPFTGEVVRRTGYADLPTAQQVRSWTRFLHTGEALGWWGQALAGLACLGGAFLVYTGFALSWRRFFRPRASEAPAGAVVKA